MSRVYIMTTAVERLPVHRQFWANLLAYADHLGASIIVHPALYRNRNNPYEEDPAKRAWWDPVVLPYTHDQSIQLNENLIYAGGIRIVPTAQKPLSGLQLYGNHASVIFPHTRQHLCSYPAANSDYAKIHQTTGAVTVASYSDTKLGAKARNHHIYGFAIAEVVDREIFHLRQVNSVSSDGRFVDSARGCMVHDGRVVDAPPAAAIRIGDSHAYEICERTVQAVERVIQVTRPERVVMDDVYSHSVAGHRLERDNWRFKRQAHVRDDTVEAELRVAFDLMQRYGATDIMHSNHHDHLDEWLDNCDGRHDPRNLYTWAYLLAKSAAYDGEIPAIELAAEDYRWSGEKPKFWRRGERCVIGDVRHDHGHEGFGGARGSANQWHRAGCKITTAHTHVEHIRDGHYQVGHTSNPSAHSYADVTKSAWSQSVCVQDAFNKRQIIRFIDGEFLP